MKISSFSLNEWFTVICDYQSVKYYQSILRPLSFYLVLILSVVFGAGRLSAETLAPGATFPAFDKLQDQHEVAYAMPEGVSHVAVAFTMSVGKSANKALAEKGATYLPKQNSVFVANIYGMPAVGRFFAMPKMKKYPHRIMLADSEGLLEDFPQKEDCVTVFDLDATGKIAAIRYWNPEKEEIPF